MRCSAVFSFIQLWQLHEEQLQFWPHLQPFSAPKLISDSSKYLPVLVDGTPAMVVAVVVLSRSG